MLTRDELEAIEARIENVWTSPGDHCCDRLELPPGGIHTLLAAARVAVEVRAERDALRDEVARLRREIEDWRGAHRQRNFERSCGG